MEQNFQTSFIPKKPMIEQTAVARQPVGLLLIISIFIFIAVALVSGGVYFYKGVLEKERAKMEGDLNLAKNRFEPTQITKLKTLDERLNYSSDILSKHIIVSPIFKALEDITMKTVRYTKFGYNSVGDKIQVTISGQAIGYRSVALQADLFTKNKNLIDPVFSNLALNDKGNVLFDLTFSVDKGFVNYQQVLKKETDNSSGVSTTNNSETLN